MPPRVRASGRLSTRKVSSSPDYYLKHFTASKTSIPFADLSPPRTPSPGGRKYQRSTATNPSHISHKQVRHPSSVQATTQTAKQLPATSVTSNIDPPDAPLSSLYSSQTKINDAPTSHTNPLHPSRRICPSTYFSQLATAMYKKEHQAPSNSVL